MAAPLYPCIQGAIRSASFRPIPASSGSCDAPPPPNGEKRHEGTDPVEVQRVVWEHAVRAERDRKKLAAMMHYAQTTECRVREGCGR